MTAMFTAAKPHRPRRSSPLLACYRGGPRRLSPPLRGATAGEKRWLECLSRMSTLLPLWVGVVRWWRYADLSKYC